MSALASTRTLLITWLGQRTLLRVSPGGKRILIDP